MDKLPSVCLSHWELFYVSLLLPLALFAAALTFDSPCIITLVNVPLVASVFSLLVLAMARLNENFAVRYGSSGS